MDLVLALKKPYNYLPSFSEELGVFAFKLVPYISLFGGLFITLASIASFVGFAFDFTSAPVTLVSELLLRGVLGVAQGIIMLFAYPQLKKGEMGGWRLLVWSQIIWIASTLLALNIGFVIGLLFLYPIFKIQKYYH